MIDNLRDFGSALLERVVEARTPPNKALGQLFEEYPEIDADEVLLTLVDTALELEEIYEQVCRDEWNDWQRVDYFLKRSSKGVLVRGGSAGVLHLKSELYRSISLIATDIIQLRLRGHDDVFGTDLLWLWKIRRSGYF